MYKPGYITDGEENKESSGGVKTVSGKFASTAEPTSSGNSLDQFTWTPEKVQKVIDYYTVKQGREKSPLTGKMLYYIAN